MRVNVAHARRIPIAYHINGYPEEEDIINLLRKIAGKTVETKPQEEKARPERVHPEQGEKPVVESRTKTSENVHGGNELTFSVEKSRYNMARSVGKKGGEKGSETVESERGQQGEKTGGSGSGSGGPRPAGNQAVNSEAQGKKSSVGGAGENGRAGGKERASSESVENTVNERGLDQVLHRIMRGGGAKNSSMVFLGRARHTLWVLDKAFEDFLESWAEAGGKGFYRTRKYDVPRLLLRRFEGKPPSKYRQEKAKNKIILILDNSGSMASLARELEAVARSALKRGVVEIYLAPNGELEAKLGRNGRAKMLAPDEKKQLLDSLVNQPILYVGDFDGADLPIELSWKNKVAWICPETRYKYFEEHDWVNYEEEDYKGWFIRTDTNARSIAEALEILAKHPYRPIWVELYEVPEPEEYEDEYW